MYSNFEKFCSLLNKLLINGYLKHVLAIIHVLKGKFIQDVEKMFNITLTNFIHEYRDLLCIENNCFNRFEISIEDLIFECIGIEKFTKIISKTCDEIEKIILSYVIDYYVKMKNMSIYGISNYLKCCIKEFMKGKKIEDLIMTVVNKYLIFDCVNVLNCREYPWTKYLINNLVRELKVSSIIPKRGYYLKYIDDFVKSNINGIEILAAIYSTLSNSIDQFQVFHKKQVEHYLKQVNYIPYVISYGFINPMSKYYIDDYYCSIYLKDLLNSTFKDIASIDIVNDLVTRYEIRITFRDNTYLKVYTPRIYYISPVFWAKDNSINLIPKLPESLDSYLSTYKTYFENSIVIFVKDSTKLLIIQFDNVAKDLLKKLLSRVKIEYELQKI